MQHCSSNDVLRPIRAQTILPPSSDYLLIDRRGALTLSMYFFLFFLCLCDSLDSELAARNHKNRESCNYQGHIEPQPSPPVVPRCPSLPGPLLLRRNEAHIAWKYSTYSERGTRGGEHFAVRFNCVASVKFAFIDQGTNPFRKKERERHDE